MTGSASCGVAAEDDSHFGVSVLPDSDLAIGVPVKPISELLRSFDLPQYRNYVAPPAALPSMLDSDSVRSDCACFLLRAHRFMLP